MMAPAPSTGIVSINLVFQFFMSRPAQSAMVRRAERKAVSPEVIGQAMTPSIASATPTEPMVLMQTS